jgi:hypothetical protein
MGLVARAQQPAMPVIGFMSGRSAEESANLLEAFRHGLKEGGVEGTDCDPGRTGSKGSPASQQGGVHDKIKSPSSQYSELLWRIKRSLVNSQARDFPTGGSPRP